MPLNRFTPGPCNCDCGETPPVCTLTFTVTGCNSQPLPGAVVTLTATGITTSTGTTNSSGQAVVGFGANSGTYTITHPSGRFASATGSFSACKVGLTASPTVHLNNAAGYSCCLSSTPYPAKMPLTITPSSGGSFTISSCNGNGCPHPSVSAKSNTSRSAITCGAFIPTIAPGDIAPGTIDARVAVAVSGGLSASVQFGANRADYGAGTTCAGVNPADPRNTIFWYSDGGCSGNVGGSGGIQAGVGTVNNASPLNVTFTFGGFSPISDITVTEAP